jgi:hypothetical protein
MKRSIKIFKSFEEQEAYHFEQMLNTTIRERFRKLYLMQQMTSLLHPVAQKGRKIIILDGHSEY